MGIEDGSMEGRNDENRVRADGKFSGRKIDQKIFDGGGCSFRGPLTISQYWQSRGLCRILCESGYEVSTMMCALRGANGASNGGSADKMMVGIQQWRCEGRQLTTVGGVADVKRRERQLGVVVSGVGRCRWREGWRYRPWKWRFLDVETGSAFEIRIGIRQWLHGDHVETTIGVRTEGSLEY